MRKITQDSAKARFYRFVAFRNRFCAWLSFVIVAIYYGFVASVGFFPEILGYRLGPSSITLGIILGIAIIAISIASTGIYTLFANKYFDKEQSEILEDLKESGALDSMIKGEDSRIDSRLALDSHKDSRQNSHSNLDSRLDSR